jgi:hypothetical protein
MLDDILNALDLGRQAVVGAGEGIGGLLEGDFSRKNFMKTLPALAGAGAGLLTGGTMAVPVGTAVGGLLQGVGNATNEDMFRSKTTPELLKAVGGDPESTWQNIALGAATDPLSYTGIGLGRNLGARAGSALERAAIARGPGYATTGSDLAGMISRYGEGGGSMDRLAGLANDKTPMAKALLSELHPGSEIIPRSEAALGHGAERVAFRTPGGRVTTLGQSVDPIPSVRGVMPYSRMAEVGDTGQWLATHAPYAEDVGKLAPHEMDQLRGMLKDQGVLWMDEKASNAGRVNGIPTAIDPGGIVPLTNPSGMRPMYNGVELPAFTGNRMPSFTGGLQPITQQANPGTFMSFLLDRLGANRSLQRSLEAGSGSLGYSPIGEALGGGLGAGLSGSGVVGYRSRMQ